MPDLDGYGVAGRIRTLEGDGDRIPIIAFTATTEKGTRERCLAAGMDEYLTKPVYVPALKATLEALIQPATEPGPGELVAAAPYGALVS